MNKQTKNLLIVGALAGAGFYAWKKGLFTGGSATEEKEETETTSKTTEETKSAEPDAVIDVQKSGLTVPQALQKAKEIAQTMKDASIIIKTPTGQPNISVTKGAKRKRKGFSLFKRRKKGKKLSAKFLQQYKKASKLNCNKYKGRKKATCIASKKKALLFMSKFQSKIV